MITLTIYEILIQILIRRAESREREGGGGGWKKP